MFEPNWLFLCWFAARKPISVNLKEISVLGIASPVVFGLGMVAELNDRSRAPVTPVTRPSYKE